MNVNIRNLLLDDEDLEMTGTFQRMPRKPRFDDEVRRTAIKKKQSHRPAQDRREVEAA